MRVKVPEEFRPRYKAPYPAYCNDMMLEQYVSKHFKDSEGERVSLPVYWTNYYCNNGYGHGRIEPLFNWLDTLDKTKKYWTVVQYDDGILQKPLDLDLLVFSAGHPSGVPLPLIPSHYLEVPNVMKGYDMSFIGNINTYPLRKKAVEETGCWKMDGLLPNDYYKSLAMTDFSLCPRGYGVTSFRLYEALHCRSVPVYISDKHWLPYSSTVDWNRIAVIVHPNELHMIREKCHKHVQDWGYYDSVKHLFTMAGIVEFIEWHLLGQLLKKEVKCLEKTK